jgi:hypothetical protein
MPAFAASIDARDPALIPKPSKPSRVLELDDQILGGPDGPDGGGGEPTDGQGRPRRGDGGETQRGPEASSYRAELFEFVGRDPSELG